MINEGKGISNNIKEDVNTIWNAFVQQSYISYSYRFGNDLIGYRDIIIKFNKLNNYYSNIQIDKDNLLTVNIGIPDNGKESKVKEIIAHELTHVIEILGLNGKDFPKYNNIKKALIKFNPKYKPTELIKDLIYKTLDNEINANVAQTYIYLISDGRISKSQAIKKLEEFKTYKEYSGIKNIQIKILASKIDKDDLTRLNDLLIENKVNTTSTDNVEVWLNYWFRIFIRKSEKYMRNATRMLEEVEKDFEKFMEYVNTNPNDNSKSFNISRFNEFKK